MGAHEGVLGVAPWAWVLWGSIGVSRREKGLCAMGAEQFRPGDPGPWLPQQPSAARGTQLG